MHDPGADDPGRFLVFVTQENLKNLIQYREWFVDGTLKIAAHLFYYIYTIHCLCQDATHLAHFFGPMAHFFETKKHTDLSKSFRNFN